MDRGRNRCPRMFVDVVRRDLEEGRGVRQWGVVGAEDGGGGG